ncbi:transposase IS4 family protein [Candidatus Moduliflexus flocculans]|uniref:Transposase IS4 family protein n=1 Tax=Candidatus Moduliflexus flocculans TaxID=1499966 RepID=A0A0S6W5E2_9BACT|nr:transposase IS4 family protein [Candidatus Moduliflexus flocculans]
MDKILLDLYTDYLLCSFGQTTATGLSAALDQAVSHDKITRFLANSDVSSRDLWQLVKPTVHSLTQGEGGLIVDDPIAEKAWTDENDIITWHFDHSKGRMVKGVNLLNCLYHIDGNNIPVAFEIITKPIRFCELKTHREKRKSEVSKNELVRHMLHVCGWNKLSFRFVLTDSWFASKENMTYIRLTLNKELVMAIQGNRTVALTEEDRRHRRLVNIETLDLQPNVTRQVFLKGVPFPVAVCQQVFKNKDGSEGVLYLVTSDTSLTYDQITTLYQKRWNVEVFHKSLNSHAAVTQSPTQTQTTQSTHFFAAIYAVFKLEQLKIKHHVNHFALRSKIYLTALKASFQKLQALYA